MSVSLELDRTVSRLLPGSSLADTKSLSLRDRAGLGETGCNGVRSSGRIYKYARTHARFG